MKVSEMIKKLKKIGCYKTKDGARHDEWYSPVTGRKFRVPRHPAKELATGTADRIGKDAGLK